MTFYIILLALSGSALSCPNVTPASNFNFTALCSGKWYEIGRYNNLDLEKDADCIVYYNFTTANEIVSLVIREVIDKDITEMHQTMYPTPEAGKVILHAHGSAIPIIPAVVLTTDNENYAVLYYCVPGHAMISSTEYAWIISRTPTMKPDVQAVIDDYINKTKILDRKKFKWDEYSVDDCKLGK